MKKWKQVTLALAVVAGLGGALVPAPAHAISVFDQCNNSADSAVCKSKGDNATSIVQSLINMLLYLLGAVAVIMIVVGGIRYATSGGDAAGIRAAKDTILYSVVGLVVAIMAYTIVNFVIRWF